MFILQYRFEKKKVKYRPVVIIKTLNQLTDPLRVCLVVNNRVVIFNFYENMYKIRKTSIYIRKYHVQNVLSDIALKNYLPISRAIINRVCQTFDLINTVLPQVNQDRRRIISVV